jgi:hypothetical protein
MTSKNLLSDHRLDLNDITNLLDDHKLDLNYITNLLNRHWLDLNDVTNLLDDHWLNPDDSHDLDLTVGVVVKAGTAAVHLVGTPKQ